QAGNGHRGLPVGRNPVVAQEPRGAAPHAAVPRAHPRTRGEGGGADREAGSRKPEAGIGARLDVWRTRPILATVRPTAESREPRAESRRPDVYNPMMIFNKRAAALVVVLAAIALGPAASGQAPV